jgi:hypothetical protein
MTRSPVTAGRRDLAVALEAFPRERLRGGLSYLAANIKYMFEQQVTPQPGISAAQQLETLEAEICELAGHLAAATGKFLILLAEFDARRGWATWDMPSCAAWLSWKCQLSSGTAREHVRVARALRALPAIRGALAAGRLSYAKARALTRIADPDTDQDLAEMAEPMTANQLDRFARAHRTVTRADDEQARITRRLTWRIEDDGSLTLTARLPPQDGAAVLTALRAATRDSDPPPHDHPPARTRAGDVPAGTRDGDAPAGTRPGDVPAGTRAGDVPAGTRAGDVPAGTRAGDVPAGTRAGDVPAGTRAGGGAAAARPTSTSLADALVEIAEAYIAGKTRDTQNPDVYQVIVHATPDALAATPTPAAPTPAAASATAGSATAGSPAAGTPAAGSPRAASTPGDRTAGSLISRCHIDDGPAISRTALQMIACDAVLSWISHDRHGNVLDAGRRRREPGPALRRALRERDHGRCRYPGCCKRATQAHHIRWWMHGGPTSLGNLISLCKAHHRLIHQAGYTIATTPAGGAFTFWRPDGKPIPPSPQLPAPAGRLHDTHDADITPDTIIPPWYGERLDLDYAIAVLFGNQRVRQEQRQAAQAA